VWGKGNRDSRNENFKALVWIGLRKNERKKEIKKEREDVLKLSCASLSSIKLFIITYHTPSIKIHLGCLFTRHAWTPAMSF
jgi:hypothetical protein